MTVDQDGRSLPALIPLNTEIDPSEPRVHDLELAKRLGYDRPRKIRELIERNLPELGRYGPAPRRGAQITRLKGLVSEVQEYWLNEGQALLVATLSNTDKSADVRELLIKTFLAYRRGQLAPPTVDAHAEYEAKVNALVARQPERDATIIRFFLDKNADRDWLPISVPAIGHATGLNRWAVQRTIERGVKQGWVERREHRQKHLYDGRVAYRLALHRIPGASANSLPPRIAPPAPATAPATALPAPAPVQPAQASPAPSDADRLILAMARKMGAAEANDDTWERAVALREAIALLVPTPGSPLAMRLVLEANVDNAIQWCDGLRDAEAQAGIKLALRSIQAVARGLTGGLAMQ